MSPLARSLLALAALLAVADAQMNCNKKIFDKTTYKPINFGPVQTPKNGGQIVISDACRSLYGDKYAAVGQKITACNNDVYGAAPDIIKENPPMPSPIDVICTDSCPSGAAVQIVQYCKALP